MSRAEMARLGWDSLDVLLVSGDAYVDHPAFGVALLGRWLVANGFRTGIIAQPDWNSPDGFLVMGRPRLFAGITAGCLDSMLAHYTAFRKKRHDDAYTPGGVSGQRPNRACLVYAGLARAAFPGLPIVLGGIEASLRRAVHYDFWTDKLRRPLVLDAKADLLVYGMGEIPLLAIARRLEETGDIPRDIPGTVFAGAPDFLAGEAKELPSLAALEENHSLLIDATKIMERQVQRGTGWLRQQIEARNVYFAPPAPALSTAGLDQIYSLPFTRAAHPAYREKIPAVEMIRDSVTTHRGCAGGCSFCSITLHQGRKISSRSRESIVAEVARMTKNSDWRGSLSDVGGPSANMWGAHCRGDFANCSRESCLVPEVCPNFTCDQGKIVSLLRELAARAEVKHLRVASGVRHDLALMSDEYVEALVGEFTGGQLKLAPEHLSAEVLRLMRKPGFEKFLRFLDEFGRVSEKCGKRQFVIPYLISAFPGCTERHMQELADWLRSRGWRPEQVQCFIPTPGTLATAMYFAGVDVQGKPIHVARTDAERLAQHAILLGEKRLEPKSGKKTGKRRR